MSNATNIALSVANIAIWVAVVLSVSRAFSLIRSDRALSAAEAASFRFWSSSLTASNFLLVATLVRARSSSIVRFFMRSRNSGLTSMSANHNVMEKK